MTPDSGCFSTNGLNSSVCSNYDLPLDINGSYVKYINTFALLDSNENESGESEDLNQFDLSFIPEKKELEKLNVFQLNELIEQVETVNKELSETLVQEFALKDELEFEKETRNTFISLLMSIQEKRRQLNLETLNSRSLTSTCKKKNRKSLISLSTEASSSTVSLISESCLIFKRFSLVFFIILASNNRNTLQWRDWIHSSAFTNLKQT